MSRLERSKWERQFEEIGISLDQLYEMTEERFTQNCQFIRESGLDCPDDEPLKKKKPGRTISGEIRDQQNEDYVRMQAEMTRKEEANARVEKRRKEIAEAKKKNQEDSKNGKLNAAKELGPEPANGVQICVVLPSGKRLIRKFDKTHLCDELFTLVTGQEEMFDDYDSIPYSLLVLNNPLKKGITFQDAGITSKTMVNVIEEEGEEEDE